MDLTEALLPLENNKIHINEVENVENVENGVNHTLGEEIVDIYTNPHKLDGSNHSDKTLDLISEDFTDDEDHRATPTDVQNELSKIFEGA